MTIANKWWVDGSLCKRYLILVCFTCNLLLDLTMMLPSYFCRITALPIHRNTTNFHRFSLHTYLRWKIPPLCRFADAATFPMLTSIQLFAICRKWEGGKKYWSIGLPQHRKRSPQTASHFVCTFAQSITMKSNLLHVVIRQKYEASISVHNCLAQDTTF